MRSRTALSERRLPERVTQCSYEPVATLPVGTLAICDGVGVVVAPDPFPVGVAVGVDVDVDVGVGVESMSAVQTDRVIVFVSIVTAPFRARTRPSTVAPVVREILVSAMIVPRNVELVPRVAELPTCQYTLQDWAPLMSRTELPDAVVSVDPAWKTKTARGSP